MIANNLLLLMCVVLPLVVTLDDGDRQEALRLHRELQLVELKLRATQNDAQRQTLRERRQQVLSEFTSELITQLNKRNIKVTKMLVDLGPEAEPALGAAVDLMRDGSQSDAARKRGAMILAAIGSAAIPDLAKALHSNDAITRAYAAAGLGGIGPAAGETAGLLLQTLTDQSPRVRRNSAKALGKIGVASPQVVAGLVAALSDDMGTCRLAAVRALTELGPVARAALPALIRKVRTQKGISDSPGPYILAVAHIAPDAPETIPFLKDMLLEERYMARLAAVEALGVIGPHARQTVPLLIELLHSSAVLRVAVLRALARIGTDDPNVFIEALRDDDASVRLEAAQALGQTALKGPKVEEALTGALQDDNGSVRKAAQAALRKRRQDP